MTWGGPCRNYGGASPPRGRAAWPALPRGDGYLVRLATRFRSLCKALAPSRRPRHRGSRLRRIPS